MTEARLHQFQGRDGLPLAYRELGAGRPLILVHGYTGSAVQGWIESGIAARVAERGYRVIMPDLRGHGDSSRPHEPAAYPPDVLGDDGVALIEQLGLDDYDLAGYSLGGRTVIRMLARGATPRRAVVGGQGLEAVAHASQRGGNYRHILTNFGTFEPGSQEQAVEDWVTASGGDPVALDRLIDTWVDTPAEALARITVPTLIMTGAADGHDRTAGALARALAAGRYLQLPGNHFTAVQAPEFEAALTGFLAEDRAEPG
jgi:pimeloyl-ACP methyl ester carboxylesterase